MKAGADGARTEIRVPTHPRGGFEPWDGNVARRQMLFAIHHRGKLDRAVGLPFEKEWVWTKPKKRKR
jgi:hypothetical protein